MNKKNKDKRQERMEDLLYVPQIVLAKYILDLEDTIDEAIEYIKEHSTTIDYKTMKADYNLNMNDLLDILKGGNNE